MRCEAQEADCMPLSEDEQRILKEIEANLNETDPALVQEVSRPLSTGTRPGRSSGRCSASLPASPSCSSRSPGAAARGGRLPGHAGMPAGDRAERPEAREGRAREPHQLDARRDAQERVRQRRAPLARALGVATTRPDQAVAVSFTAAQAARLTGCSLSQLSSWERLGLVVPPAGRTHPYTFQDLVALRVVASLLDAGLSLARIRRAVRYLVESGEDVAASVDSSPTATRCGRAATTDRSSTRCATGSSLSSSVSTGSRPTWRPRSTCSMPNVRSSWTG